MSICGANVLLLQHSNNTTDCPIVLHIHIYTTHEGQDVAGPLACVVPLLQLASCTFAHLCPSWILLPLPGTVPLSSRKTLGQRYAFCVVSYIIR